MSKQIINIGSGVGSHDGDGARTGAQKINENFTEVYDNIDLLISESSIYNKIIASTGFSLTGQNLTVNANWQWLLSNVAKTNPADVVINIPFCSTGKSRIEYVVPNDSNGFSRIIGAESATTPVAPLIPNEDMYVTWYLVDDGSIGVPSQPITGDNYISKSSQSPRRSYDSGIIDLENETRIILYTCTEINYINHLIPGQAYDGRELFLTNENEDESDIVINNLFNHKGNFSFPNALPFTLKFKETIQFKLFYDFGNKVTYLYVGVIDEIPTIEVADVVGLPAALDLKLDAADYNQHFKGVYLTEAALITAHPTGVAGDTAQVNEVGATDVVNYSWDAEEGIWVNNGTGGSGAVNTDALPEGSTNLYWTVARFLANLTYANVIAALGFTPSTAPNDAQKNSDITKAEIEAKLTGEITTHTHPAVGGVGDMVLASTQTVSGLKTFLSGMFGLRNVANTFTSFLTNTVTAARTWTFPDKDGTVAMTSDIPINTSLPINPTVIGASTYILVIGDANLTTKYTFSGGLVITLSADATTNFPIGTVIKGYSTGGTISIAPAGGVTINGNSQTGINSVFSIFKISANYWQMESLDKAAPVFTGGVKTSGSYFNTVANMGYFGYDNASGMYFDGNYVYFRVYGGGFKFSVPVLLGGVGAGEENVVSFSTETVNPTSGSKIFNFIKSSPTINQTGGASGIVRSIYINPTLTSAFDFRAIEIVKGSIVLPYLAKTTTYSISNNDYLIDCTSGTFTVTLPTAVGQTGKIFIVKNSGSGTITVATTSSQTIDGNTTYSLATQYMAITLVSNGTNWIITSKN